MDGGQGLVGSGDSIPDRVKLSRQAGDLSRPSARPFQLQSHEWFRYTHVSAAGRSWVFSRRRGRGLPLTLGSGLLLSALLLGAASLALLAAAAVA